MAPHLRVVMLTLLGLAIAAPPHGRARPAGAGREAVQPLIDAATDAVNGRDYAAARRSLAEAYRKSRASELLFRLAEVEQLDGHEVAARDFYRRYLAEAADDSPDSQAAAQKQLGGPAPPSGELAVVSERGALVLLDDQVVGVLPLSLPLLVTPGAHKVAIEVGKRQQEDRVDVLAGRTIEVRFPMNTALIVVTMAPALITRTAFDGLAEPMPQRLADAVAAGVRQRKLGAQPESAALVVAPELAACLRTPDCQQQLARKNQVSWVLTVTGGVSQAAANGFALTFDLFDATSGEYLIRTNRTCGPCTIEKAAALVTETTAAVVAEAQGLPRDATAGSKPLATAPVITDTPAAGKGRRPLWRLIVGPLAMAAGVSMIGVGAAGLAVNQRCVTVDETNPELCQPFQDMTGTNRATIYDTFTPGLSLVISGSVLAVAGVVLVAIPGKSASEKP
jgi:hypothetical protein